MPVDSIQPDQATAAPVSQQSSPDQAAGDRVAVSTSSDTPASTSTGSTSSSDPSSSQATTEIELLSQADYDAVKDDPVALKKALNKAFTQKTQELSEHRKRLEPWNAVIDGLSDPQRAVQTLEVIGRQLGVNIVRPDANPAAAAPAAPVVSATEQQLSKLKQTLDTYGMGEVSDVLVNTVRNIAADIASEHIKPIAENTHRLLSVNQQQEVSSLMSRFESRHPDWKQHESKIIELSHQFKPAVDDQGRRAISDDAYLDQLYLLATYDTTVKNSVASQIQKMTDAARQAEPQSTTVTSDKVSQRAPKGAGWSEIVAAAKRGERWE